MKFTYKCSESLLQASKKHLQFVLWVEWSKRIFQFLKNSLISSTIALVDKQVSAAVTSTSTSTSTKAGMFLISGFYSSPVYRDGNTFRLHSPLRSHGWWLSTRTIRFGDLCPSKHLLIWLYSSFIRENTLDEWCSGSRDARVRIYRV